MASNLTGSVLDIAARNFGNAQKFVNDIVCRDLDKGAERTIIPHLLGAIYLSLQEIVNALTFGSNYYRITPVTLTAGGDAQPICEVQNEGRVRKVSVWVDAVQGPLPVLRISTGAGGTGSGGIRIPPGQVSELGEVPPNTRLFVSSSQAVTLYVIERA